MYNVGGVVDIENLIEPRGRRKRIIKVVLLTCHYTSIDWFKCDAFKRSSNHTRIVCRKKKHMWLHPILNFGC